MRRLRLTQNVITAKSAGRHFSGAKMSPIITTAVANIASGALHARTHAVEKQWRVAGDSSVDGDAAAAAAAAMATDDERPADV